MKKLILVMTVIVAIFSFALTSQASTVTLNLDVLFSGTSPSGSDPSLTATFTDDGLPPGTVKLTMDASNLTSSEFVSNWYFNIDDNIDINSLEIDPDPALAGITFIVGTNANKADGDGYYDILFSFPDANSSQRFSGGTSTWTFSGISDLTIDDFKYFSSPGGDGSNGTYLSAVHVQGIPLEDGTTTSGWLGAVPIPATVWIFGAGLIGLVGIRRKIRN